MTENANNRELIKDRIRGCMIGGAAGDALGYAVEFKSERGIFEEYGENCITAYELDGASGKALISDDTQMTLFTAAGLLLGDTRFALRGIRANPGAYVEKAYRDWLNTQNMTYEEFKAAPEYSVETFTWLSDVPGLYHRRAPGNTCLSALSSGKSGSPEERINDSKGCGGIMRVAPLALNYGKADIKVLDEEGARIAALTHGHSLGFIPAAMLTHIISRIVFSACPIPLENIVSEALDTVGEIFCGDPHLGELTQIIRLAVALSANGESDLANIRRLGAGWVAEETLAIAVYCALRHRGDFSAGIIAAVNHGGDRDSTGSVTGNIHGALLGYSAIGEKWKKDLELREVILELADDVARGCPVDGYSDHNDPDWMRKYAEKRRPRGM